MVYGNRRSNYVLRNHASSPIGLSAISFTSIRLMRSIVRFQRSYLLISSLISIDQLYA